MQADHDKPLRRRIQLELPVHLLTQIDALKDELGHRSRGALLEQLLKDLFRAPEGEPDGDNPEEREGDPLLERGALVLVTAPQQGTLVFETDPESEVEAEPEPRARASRRPTGAGGIDLPGFVRQSSARLRQSLRPTPQGTSEPLPGLATGALEQALLTVREHWMTLYGTEAGEMVLEAAMLWLGQEVWPQSDQAEGRPFTWTLLEQWIEGFVAEWPAGPPSFDRVMVAAGLLEDPFSGGTLSVRMPTLIRRFVHRFRQRRRGASFQALEHTMTIQGALKLLDLPTTAGHRLSLEQIREAYRDQALNHHPDSGGNADAMRRLNEAYQLLKELYRRSA